MLNVKVVSEENQTKFEESFTKATAELSTKGAMNIRVTFATSPNPAGGSLARLFHLIAFILYDEPVSLTTKE
jgi:hypothetical protein